VATRWMYYQFVEEAIDDLKDELKEELRGEVYGIKRIEELIKNLEKFDKTYFDGTSDVCLGYVIIHNYTLRRISAKAIVIIGDVDYPKIELVDVEEWLSQHENPDP
jgi:hypothetical protein